MRCSQHVATETPPIGQVVLRILLEEGNALCLVAGHAVKPPGEKRDPLGEHGFEVSAWGEAFERAEKVALPVLTGLDSGDHGSWGTYPVAGSVPARHLLTPFGLWSSIAGGFQFCGHALAPFLR